VCSEFGGPNSGEQPPPPRGGAGGSRGPFPTVGRRRASRLPARHPRARPAPTRRPIPPDHIRCRSISEERSGASRHGAWPRPPRRPGPLRHGALARSPTPARSRLADPFPRSHTLPVDIGGTERRVPPRRRGLAPPRRPRPLPRGALARSPAPARPRHPAPTPRPQPLRLDIGGPERRVSPRCPALAPSRRLAAPAGPAARAQQRAPCLASLGLAALRLASLCASPPRSVPPGVGAEREGALGAASALDGVI